MTLRVGLIGAGLIAELHADRWRRLPVKLAGFYDIDAQKAARLANTFGGETFPSREALIRAVDIVQVCTPTQFRKEVILSAASERRFIFTEKPLATRPREAQEIVDACAAAGVRLYVGQVLRFFPQYAHARRLVHDGAIGTPGLIRMIRAAVHPMLWGEGREWFRDTQKTSGAIMEGGIHDLDFARWTLGEVDHIFARGITMRDDLDLIGDHVLAVMRFQSGVIGHVEGSWMVTDGSFRQKFLIAGDQGMLEYDSFPQQQLFVSLRSQQGQGDLPAAPLAQDDEPYFAQSKHFLTCIQQDKEFLVKPQDGVEAVRMSVAALESMRTGKPVIVAEVQ